MGLNQMTAISMIMTLNNATANIVLEYVDTFENFFLMRGSLRENNLQ